MKSVDVIIIGGGLSGSAIALGLVRHGIKDVLLYDEQLPSQRLSRGNFGLTWFMCKGANSSAYAKWSRMACQEWLDFAASLKEDTGESVDLEWTGGAVQAFGEDEFKGHAESIDKIKASCEKAGIDYPVRMLNRAEFADLVPEMELGDEVSGAMYTKEQGHVNPLRLLTAMRSSFQQNGGTFYGSCSVTAIEPQKDGSIIVKSKSDTVSCHKLVIAAGHGSTRLVASLGEKLHIYPQRGQLMVSQRHKRVLRIPVLCTRQSPDGNFFIGLSTEDTALDTRTTMRAMANQAKNALRLFPMLGKINWLRSWGAIRVMTPDGGPIYSKIAGHDNITVVALHSALSLAPLAVSKLAPWIAGTQEHELISTFSNGRFNV